MFLRHLAPSIAWALLILLLCGIPGSQLPTLDLLDLLNFDKLVHFVLFLMQVLLLCIGLKKQHRFTWLRYYGVSVALIAGLFYGTLTELLQLYIFTGRTYDFLDLLADAAGSFAGVGTFFLIYRTT